MNEKKLFRIGEVAKMFHISMGTLRHYEQEGILTPEYTDERTGYRYYSTRQFEVLNTIRYLRVLDIPLSEIGEFLVNRDVDVIEEKLVRQKELIEQKKKELDLISRKIDHRLERLRDAVDSSLGTIQEERIPACRIVWIRDDVTLHTYLDLEYSIRKLEANQTEPIAFLGKVGVGIPQKQLEQMDVQNYQLVFLVLDEEDCYEGETEELPETRCVTIRFCGSHREAGIYYKKLLNYIAKQHLQITGFSREITLIDYGMTSDPEKFVTEIRIPVA